MTDGMSATSGHNLVTARSYTVARQRRLRAVLLGHRSLTRHALYELSHAEHWHVPFDVALRRAVRAGRVRRLTDDLYAAGRRR
jgi:hypothetical protein